MMLLRWCQEGKDFIAQVLKDEGGKFYWRYAPKGKDPLVWVQSQAPKGTLGECVDEVMSMFGPDEIEVSMTPGFLAMNAQTSREM